jgi:acetolactate synthase-1/2/3 large subunit
MATCSEIIADTLKERGVGRIFGIPGGEILELIEACRKVGIEFVLTRHESVAAFMADVSGQITGIPGVCLSTVGPGATNLINGVANAYLDRSPVLVFSAQLSTSSQPYATHQFIRLDKLFEPVTKKVFDLLGKKTASLIKEGFRIATTGPKGPVFFCLPSDIAKIEEEPVCDQITPSMDESLSGSVNRMQIVRIAEEIRKAQRPLVLLGIGIDPKRETEIVRQFVKRNRLPVMATPKAKGIFPDGDSLFLGTASGMMADGLIVGMIKKADLVIGIGYDPVESDQTWHKDIRLLSINGYPITYQSYLPYMDVVGEIKTILGSLMVEDFSSHEWREDDLRIFKENLRKKLIPTQKPRQGTFSPYTVVQKIREILPEGAVVTTDVGAHKCLMGQAWKAYHPLTFFMSNGLSSMGYGLPAAIAAKLCLPQAQVVCVTGDGGFTMMLQDLETAVRLNLPVVILVFCDGSLGLIEMVQKRLGYPQYGVNFNKVKFASVAAGFGARGIKLRSLSELSKTLLGGFNSDRPTVVEIPIDGSEYLEQL